MNELIKPDTTLTDSELNEIIKAPRPLAGSGRSFSITDIRFYFTKAGKEQPSWKYMDRDRMREILTDHGLRLAKNGNDEKLINQIESALAGLS